MKEGEIWYGRPGTPYEGVEARIDVVTVRKVSCTYNRIVEIDGMRLAGEVMPKGKFMRMFEQAQQLNLFE
ncbi:hypothetical protein [Thermoactinomyces sp. CICC 10522]|uniref:hypothetical protein n=1 Tax=Thermoactinomyces sp. CICC 10522 TaxID=2767427 RepID=UPI0018DBC404|nr:hypothetical protein [Thermoactinomyces sp. CICC 10522]MBH8605622.1 hypothetical protein [Thermoactinomyces sp. CICC 10522]